MNIMQTKNEMCRVFLEIWEFNWGETANHYGDNGEYPGYRFRDSRHFKKASLFSKTNNLIEHDRLFNKLDEKGII